MIPDAECVRIVAEILEELELGNFTIKVIVNCMMERQIDTDRQTDG